MKLRYPAAKHDVTGRMKIRGKYRKGFPEGAIVHFTAGRGDPVNTINGGKEKHCYFVIAPDGTVYQSFGLDEWGQHAGKSTWNGFETEEIFGVSKYFVGIEICNAGKVRQIDEDTFRPWYNDPEYYKKQKEPIPRGIPKAADDFTRAQVRYVEKKENREAGWYHSYTAAQEAALETLILWLKNEAPDIFRLEHVLGHDEVSPGRKNDPGGALSLTMPDFRKKLAAALSPATPPPAREPSPPPAAAGDSSGQEDPGWVLPSSSETWFGRIIEGSILRTATGDLFLSAAADAAAPDPRSLPFDTARERVGQFVAIKGKVSGGVITSCSIVEAVPPVASTLLAKLLDPQRGLRDVLLGIAQETKDELFGNEPPPPAEDPLIILPSGPKPLCVIDIGHSPRDKGAEGALDGKEYNEFDYNSGLAEMITPLVGNAEIIVIHRNVGKDGYKTLPADTNRYNPAFAVSLHANSSSPAATGSEVLHYASSKEGRKLAAILQEQFLKALGLPDRGLKPRTSADRGGLQLFATKAPIVIGEPFFISNTADLRAAVDKKGALAAAYATAIDAYAATLSQPAATATSSRSVASLVESGTSFSFEHENLGKEAFLKRNSAALLRITDAVNKQLAGKYGAGCLPVTKEDVWVTLYCEAGLKAGGKVDPDHKHSAGERGLLPLPSNVAYWNGSGAPAPDRPMPLARNIEHFLLYLGALKNKEVKSVAGLPLYRGLFTREKIQGNAVRQAKLLAGVIHGYFFSANYRDRTVPYQDLITGYQNDTGLAALMHPTTYVYARTNILASREQNITAALALL